MTAVCNNIFQYNTGWQRILQFAVPLTMCYSLSFPIYQLRSRLVKTHLRKSLLGTDSNWKHNGFDRIDAMYCFFIYIIYQVIRKWFLIELQLLGMANIYSMCNSHFTTNTHQANPLISL